ncbi:CU044_5270 family protein [Actinomadura opuntiae]|uniref:CU044_5270 family protein n=1 Tax=Actinomadura sp. OS1-43 TaxID=604315 RepID=UPI00255B3849|nr:CU044_5270 family protein [Actinomadura sp. OS1-43]MDL4820385.1 CU044_5270 family protein [Actinomadura sp. OS1-43]
MNDLHEVRRIMAPADPCPPGAFDGAAHDPAGRAAYARITASAARRPGPSRRTTFRLVAAGGVAGALVAGAVVATSDGKPHHLAATETQQVLNVAATFALKQPFTAPRPGQWVYTETRYRRSGVPARGQVVKPGAPLSTTLDRIWIRADGKRMAMYDHGKLATSATGGGTPPIDYATVSKLPADAGGMLAWARKEGTPGGRNEGAFQLLGSLLLNNGALPPAQTAAAYRAMAKIPGVTVDRSAKDGAGHKAVSVSFVIEGWAKDEILLDPSTYAYQGHRTTVARDHTMPDGGRFLKGAVESYSVRLATGVVDRPGRRP